ncbi:hypothetical protein VCHA50O413_10175 [Vibrio chagasii]|nr:hypothetical protein VCHA36P168_10405 [Vibrio chagasii]CAH6933770.1 hypothetical protein VCHA50O409_10175 [Vibrio chagasii]CAH6970950.1 Conserved hypothetical protein [Vibrio chagasii]CAH7025819.1 hypothetical protein VCHA50O413_10175 [Vibrio chagasii]CAH7049171.1 hypothetical protein VCHA42P256_10536 [Vibrio chagasii]
MSVWLQIVRLNIEVPINKREALAELRFHLYFLFLYRPKYG